MKSSLESHESRLINSIKHWLTGGLYRLDEEGNEELLDASEDETISANCGSQYVVGHPCEFCRLTCTFIQDWLGVIFPKLRTHCADSWARYKLKKGIK